MGSSVNPLLEMQVPFMACWESERGIILIGKSHHVGSNLPIVETAIRYTSSITETAVAFAEREVLGGPSFEGSEYVLS